MIQKKQKTSLGVRLVNFLIRGLIFVFVTGLISLIFYKIAYKNQKQKEIDKEIAGLEKQIEKLKGENQELNLLFSYVKTDEFKEREIKDKLNLIKEGEEVVLVQGAFSEKEEKKQPEKNPAEVTINKPNYYWWWHYFFSVRD